MRFRNLAADAVEVGQIDDALTHVPQTVVLSRSYAQPVVFAQPLSTDGAATSVVRVTEVLSDRFTLYVHEAPNYGGGHATETVSYIVLEAGTWQVAGGKQLQVGTLATNATVGVRVSNVWAGVTFSETFSSAPVVLSQVQSNDDPHWVKTRQRYVGTGGFQVALEEEEASAYGPWHGDHRLAGHRCRAGHVEWARFRGGPDIGGRDPQLVRHRLWRELRGSAAFRGLHGDLQRGEQLRAALPEPGRQRGGSQGGGGHRPGTARRTTGTARR